MRRPTAFFYKRLVRCITLVLLSGLCWGCMHEDVSTSQTLNIAENKQPNRIHPLLSRSLTAKAIEQMVFQPLIRYDEIDEVYKPILLERLPQLSTVYRDSQEVVRQLVMRLRDDARWPDGRAVTAGDVMFTYKAIMNPHSETAALRRNLTFLKGAEIDRVDSLTFVFFVDTSAQWVAERACQLQILPAHHYDSVGWLKGISLDDIIKGSVSGEEDEAMQRFAQTLVHDRYSRSSIMGSGPYRLERWVSDYDIVLSRQPNWWGMKYSDERDFMANPAEIHYRFIADDQLAMQALEAGDVDLMTDVRAAKFDAMRQSRPDDYHYLTPTVPQYVFLILNHQSDGMLSDKGIRQALAHLIDQKAIISALLYDYGQEITGPFLPSSPYYADDVQPYPVDTSLAMEGLRAAGYRQDVEGRCVRVDDGLPLTLRLHITGSATSKQVALILKEQLGQVGIELEVITQRFNPNTVEDMNKGDFDMVLALRTFNELPVSIRSNWYTVADAGIGANYGRFSHPQVDSLIDAIEEVGDIGQVAEMTKELHRVLHEEVAVLYLWAPQQRIVVSKRWQPATSSQRPGYQAALFSVSAKQ